MSFDQKKTATTGHEVGLVRAAKDYLLTIEGLPSAKLNDLISDEQGNLALVTSLVEEGVEALSLYSVRIQPGTKFYKKDKQSFFSFGEHLFGKVINALGRPMADSQEMAEMNAQFMLDVVAPGVDQREKVAKQFVTGITMLDTIFPLGKGQRQMVFGPIKSGKTQLLTNIIRNQASTDTVCIYSAIGKSSDFLDYLLPLIFGENGNSDTIVLSALSNEISPMISIAPAVSLLLAEHFQKQGRDVLLVMDDLGAHAKYLREINLLKGLLPGRESYPGDLFYQQAHLMERGGRFSDDIGGGSITILPVLKTDIESYSDLLSTNLIACTDGHLSCSSALYRQGNYPSIVTEESVTRVGRNTQTYVQKQLSVKVVSVLAEYKKQQEYTKFGTQTSEYTERILHQGKLLKNMLKQDSHNYLPIEVQVMFLCLAFTEFLDEREEEFLQRNKDAILEVLKEDENFKEIRQMVEQEIELEDFISNLEQKTPILEETIM